MSDEPDMEFAMIDGTIVKVHRHGQGASEFGHPKLKEHLTAVIALMRAAPSWDSFRHSLQRTFPRYGETTSLPLDNRF